MLPDGVARPATGLGQRRLPAGLRQMGLGMVINELS